MAARKRSTRGVPSRKAEWQLDVLRAALESRTLTIDKAINIIMIVFIFSLGGLTSSWLSNARSTLTVGFFLFSLGFSTIIALVALVISGKKTDRFRQRLLLLSKGKPLPQASFERMFSESQF
ncbi:MAG: hypothetical protein ABSF09_14000 [Candidatus Bathyarchaeia archaeon]